MVDFPRKAIIAGIIAAFSERGNVQLEIERPSRALKFDTKPKKFEKMTFLSHRIQRIIWLGGLSGKDWISVVIWESVKTASDKLRSIEELKESRPRNCDKLRASQVTF
jgi:hypothetical protein